MSSPKLLDQVRSIARVKHFSLLLRIGAQEEGTLRNHMIVHDGRYRHTVYFSVIDSEWPEVKATLEARLLR